MKKYKIRIFSDALTDMEEIYQYIALDLQSPDAAFSQYNRIADAIMSLEYFPERCRIFSSGNNCIIRKKKVDSYLVFYSIHGNTVDIMAVFYGASDIRSRLKERM